MRAGAAERTRDELFREWAGWFRALGRRWHGYAAPLDRRSVGPDDLAQEFALVAARRFGSWNPERVQFRTWVAQLARRHASYLRKRALGPNRAAVVLGSAGRDGAGVFAAVADGRAAEPWAVLAAREAVGPVLVPICDLGAGTGAAWVLDARTGARVKVPGAELVLVGRGLCVRALGLDVAADGRLRRVELPGGAVAWVEAAPG